MSIVFTRNEMEYVCSNEFQHPQTRPEKRRAKLFMNKWIQRARKDSLFQSEVIRILESIKKGEVSEKDICDDVDAMLDDRNKPSQNS